MSIEEDKPGLPLVPSKISDQNFGPRSDLTYRLIENVHLVDQSLHQSLLTGSILRHCSFQNVDFSRCDLDGMRLENCTFERCEFQGADIRSTTLSACTFNDSRLDQILLTDCTLTNCCFKSSSFHSAVISSSSFISCSFFSCPLRRASCTLDKFVDSLFDAMTLGDCTFLYMVLKSCRFQDTTINAESIGMIFGLSRADLRQLNFIYLGEKQDRLDDEDLFQVLIDSYSGRNWVIGVAITRLNFHLTSDVFALRDYLQSFIQDVGSGRAIKAEELRFLMDVLRELRSEGRLPLLNVIEIIEASSRLLAQLEHSEVSRDFRGVIELRRLSNDLLALMQNMIDAFEEARFTTGLSDSAVIMQVNFKERPALPLSQLLNELVSVAGFQVVNESSLIEVRDGSFIEIVSSTLFSVLAFQIFLFLLNGCLIQVTEIKARIQVLARKKLPETYVQDALQARQGVPSYLAGAIRHLTGYVGDLQWLADPQLKGLSTDNINDVEIQRSADPGGYSPTPLREN